MTFEIPLLTAVHVLLAVLWVGGMAFAWLCLRPAAGEALEGMQRPRLWLAALRRFFALVWIAAVGLPLTGYRLGWLLYGGPANFPPYVHTMQALAWVMIALFVFARFAPYRRLATGVGAADANACAGALARMRQVVGINLAVGVLLIAVAAGGRYAGG